MWEDGPDRIKEAWWLAWRHEDYSWPALNNKPLDGEGGAWGEFSLQDYWRRDPSTGETRDDDALLRAGELIRSPEGELWHIAHVPLRWYPSSEPEPTEKIHWDDQRIDKLKEVLTARLAIAQAITVGTFDDRDGQDGRAQFQGAIVPEMPDKWMDGVEAHVNFTQAYFAGRVDFQKQSFGLAAVFDRALFADYFAFDEAIVNGWSSFDDCAFLGIASFRNCEFRQATEFGKTLFDSSAEFEHCFFGDRADFRGCTFRDRAEFGGAVFREHGLFSDVQFLKRTSFAGSQWHGEAEFHGARLHVDTTFDRASFVFLDKVRRAVGSVTAVLFAFAIVLTAWECLTPRLTLIILSITSWMLLTSWAMIRPHIQLSDDKYFRDDRLANLFPWDHDLERLMRGYRTLTLLCETVRNKRDAARFYRLELIATRLRAGNEFERVVSSIYGWASDYGESLWRPIIALALTTVIFSGLYWSWEFGISAPQLRDGQVTTRTYAELVDAIEFSTSRTFPLGPWGADAGDPTYCSFRDRFLANDRCRPDALPKPDAETLSIHRLLARLVATAQSILSVIFLFLFGLSVRRRFQMN